MSEQGPGQGGAFHPEYLAGYVDGELDATARREVDAWLSGHPDAAADVEAQRRLAALWRESSSALPPAAKWERVLARIASALPSRPHVRPIWRDDVEIVRIQAADRMSLVVGSPPLEEGEVQWVLPGDVRVERVSKDSDGMEPLVAVNKDGPIAAMIMPPRDQPDNPAP
jgi:anti-sigma factor RsiW